MKKETKIQITDKAVNKLLGAFAKSLKDGRDFIPSSAYITENFYSGTETFLSEPAKKGKWYLGSASVDLTPADYAERDYYLGGYMAPENGFKNLVESVVDSMQGRAIAVDDGSDRGISVFCTVDCIGITNGDIRLIRKKFAEKFKTLYPDKKIASVNIFATHTHSCIDTEGLWTEFPSKIFRNIKRNKTGRGIPEQGTDEQYMRFLREKVSDVLTEAVKNMCKGEITLAQKDITQDYFNNKNRPSATGLVTDITRLVFTPSDKKKRPTMIVNLPAHPDVAGLPVNGELGSGRRLCGDYIYYMGDIINKAGYDFMFFNGAICGIYTSRNKTNDCLHFEHRYQQSARFGREMGRIALSLTKSFSEIKKDTLLYDKYEITRESAAAAQNGGAYTLWCEDWEPVKEVKVEPFFNIAIKEVKVPVTNPIILAAGKLHLANYKVLADGNRGYSVYTEIGYMEFGNQLKVVCVPGEFCCDLLVGGASLYADGSVSKKDFSRPYIRKIFGEDTVAFGLANDEIGYIVPDNDYTMGDPANHYHEFVSLGEFVGSGIMHGFVQLAHEIKQKRIAEN